MRGNQPIEKMLDSKVIAAAATTYAATIIVGWLATKVGVDIEVSTATAFIAPLLTAGITFGVGFMKKDARIAALLDFYRRVQLQGTTEEPEPDEGLDEPPAGTTLQR